ncbi:MAG TPA: DUF5916 domain-containing protein [Pyrinomonadaceae bacterium]
MFKKLTLTALILTLAVLCPAAALAQEAAAVPEASAVAAEKKAEGGPAAAPAADPARAAAEKQRPVSLTRFEKTPVIDGRLDDEPWKQAAVLQDFYQTQPGDNTAASRPTRVLLGYDNERLYIGFHAYDEPGSVRATVAKRDGVLEDDNVRIYLDTFGDQRRAYVFIFNPLGVQQDGVLTEGGAENYSVDVVMESKGALVADGYTVEVAIPFKSLRYIQGKDKLWGVHVLRSIKHLNDEQNSWQPLSRGKSGFLTQAGHLSGIEGVSGERTLELIPSLTVSESGLRVEGGGGAASPDRFANKGLKLDPGLTAKIGITPTVTLDLAVNPDFAQVEADELVVTANQRFPIFFEEKRPFFLEGIDIFNTPLQAVDTRAIVDPSFAVKLTGKQGRTTFGLLGAADAAPGNFSEEERADPTVIRRYGDLFGKSAYIGVVRLKRDVGRENSLGFTGTTYNFKGRHNHLGGFDGRFRLSETTTFQFQALGTTARETFFDADLGRNIYRTGNGFGYSYRIDSNSRNWKNTLSGSGRTRDYRAAVGFTRRTDTNIEGLKLQYVSDPKPKAALVSWSALNYTQANFDWRGRSQFVNTNSSVSFNFQRQGYLGLGYQRGYERLFEEEFGPKRAAARAGTFLGEDSERSATRQIFSGYAGMTPTQAFSFDVEAIYTKGAFDFDFGAGPRYPRVSPAALADPDAPLDPGPGDEFTLLATATYKPTSALRLSFNYTKDRLVRDDTKRLAYDVDILGLRGTYQFSRFTFLRARLDYDTLAARMRGQLLLGWAPNPGTAFYAGYNDDVNYNGYNPFTGLHEPGFRRNGRTFFVKMSYLFRRAF